MKKITIILLVLISLISCQQTVETTDKPNVFIRNVIWDKVQEFNVTGRAVDTLEGIEEIVDDHNATTTDDHWYIDTEDTPIELAPTAEFYIIFTDTNEVSYHITVERARVESERAWILQNLQDYSQQYLRPVAFYIDTEVPAYKEPYVEPVYDPYVRYSFYAIAADGSIVWEEHCTENPNYWNLDGSINEDNCKIRMLCLTCAPNQFPGQVRFVAGEIYTPPAVNPDPIIEQ